MSNLYRVEFTVILRIFMAVNVTYARGLICDELRARVYSKHLIQCAFIESCGGKLVGESLDSGFCHEIAALALVSTALGRICLAL